MARRNAEKVCRVLRMALLGSTVTPVLFAGSAWAVCIGPGAPADTQTKCLTAVPIPGNPLKAFDISFVNPDRAEYYLADRSNARIDVVDTQHDTFKRKVGDGVFAGVQPKVGPPNNNISGPDGVVTHGRWLYAGDGDSTLKVFDLNGPAATPVQTLDTGATPKTRVDEMAITTDGRTLFAANNAADPPFGTLFHANGDAASSNVTFIARITVSATIIPPGDGLSIEQPAWDPTTKRFYTSIPTIANNPTGCDVTQAAGHVQCSGGLLVLDPNNLGTPSSTVTLPGGQTISVFTLGAFDKTTNTGVVPLNECGPNGSAVGSNDNLLLGCTPGNEPSNTSQLVINAKTKNFANIGGITGSDEVWFNGGDKRYYTASSADPTGAVLGVINAETNLLIETVPQSSGSHSVAADAERNKIFVPESAADTTTVGAGICGTTNGCIGVYVHHTDEDDQD